MKRISLMILCLSLTADLAFAAGGVPGAVLCIGAEEHFAIESATAACCDFTAPEGPPARSVSLRSETKSPAGDCGNCTDVPISGVRAAKIAKRVSRNAWPLSASVASLQTDLTGVEEAPLDGRSPPYRLLPPVSMPAQRSVVLLI